MLSTNREA
jgi:hypothetical protein